jgi:hypothetical protein
MGRDHFEDLGVDGKLEWILGKGVDWMDLAQDRVQWQARVNMDMNLRVPLKGGEFLD